MVGGGAEEDHSAARTEGPRGFCRMLVHRVCQWCGLGPLIIPGPGAGLCIYWRIFAFLVTLVQEAKEKLEVRVAIQGRVDDLGAKAVAFSKALVRGTQALKTAARIAREAAMSFESEMENFIQAQKSGVS